MKQAEKTERTVSRILAEATAEFGQNGYACGTVNHICKRGISKGLIYHNFKGRDELYLTCLKESCKKLEVLIRQNGSLPDLLQYIRIRMRFFAEYPNEAHMFLEALLQPQPHLADEIHETMLPLDELNEQIYRAAVSSVTLRDGITEEDALHYFRQMQRMFNGYFSSPANRPVTLDEQIREHETNLPKLLDFMLYGIAKGDMKK